MILLNSFYSGLVNNSTHLIEITSNYFLITEVI